MECRLLGTRLSIWAEGVAVSEAARLVGGRPGLSGDAAGARPRVSVIAVSSSPAPLPPSASFPHMTLPKLISSPAALHGHSSICPRPDRPSLPLVPDPAPSVPPLPLPFLGHCLHACSQPGNPRQIGLIPLTCTHASTPRPCTLCPPYSEESEFISRLSSASASLRLPRSSSIPSRPNAIYSSLGHLNF